MTTTSTPTLPRPRRDRWTDTRIPPDIIPLPEPPDTETPTTPVTPVVPVTPDAPKPDKPKSEFATKRDAA
jgi:hypothetical protein